MKIIVSRNERLFTGVFLFFFLSIAFIGALRIESVFADKRRTTLPTQAYYNGLNIEHIVAGPDSHGEDVLNVFATVKDNDTQERINEDEMEVHNFHVYGDTNKEDKVTSGELTYNDETEEWEVKDFDLSWTGNGQFYVTVEFQTNDMDNPVETDIDEEIHTYSRANMWEPVLIALIAIGIILGIGIPILVIRERRQETSIKRKKEKKKKDIKIKGISKEEIKKSEKRKKKEKKKKEKGKTEEKEDLIFSVPEWETDDEE